MWLRTANSAASVAQARRALVAPPYTLASIQDRFQLTQGMALDPLSAALEEIITLGIVIVFFLALIVSGQIIGGILEQRTLNLSALYAIGASQGQIMLISASENIVELLIAALIGLALGVALTLTATPLMTFAQSQDTNLPLAALQIPPPQIVIPLGPMLTWIGLTLIAAAVTITVAARALVTRRIIANLRLNED